MTPGEIKDLIDAIYHGTADPDDAKKLLKLFCDCIDNSEPIPDDILGFLKHAFTSVLTEEKTLDKALGLKRKRGTPRLILAEKLFISEGQIKKCWANYEEEARLLLRIENYLENSSQE